MSLNRPYIIRKIYLDTAVGVGEQSINYPYRYIHIWSASHVDAAITLHPDTPDGEGVILTKGRGYRVTKTKHREAFISYASQPGRWVELVLSVDEDFQLFNNTQTADVDIAGHSLTADNPLPVEEVTPQNAFRPPAFGLSAGEKLISIGNSMTSTTVAVQLQNHLNTDYVVPVGKKLTITKCVMRGQFPYSKGYVYATSGPDYFRFDGIGPFDSLEGYVAAESTTFYMLALHASYISANLIGIESNV